jgi:hypothetical protein
LNQTGQQGDQRLSGRSRSKAGHEGFDGDPRGYFTAILTSYTIGESEEPAPKTGLLACLRDKTAEIVFIRVPH